MQDQTPEEQEQAEREALFAHSSPVGEPDDTAPESTSERDAQLAEVDRLERMAEARLAAKESENGGARQAPAPPPPPVNTRPAIITAVQTGGVLYEVTEGQVASEVIGLGNVGQLPANRFRTEIDGKKVEVIIPVPAVELYVSELPEEGENLELPE
jgi:hypothetical protein